MQRKPNRIVILVPLALVAVSAPCAYGQDEGWSFPDPDSSWVIAYTPLDKTGGNALLSGSPYRFPPDWNPPHRYPEPEANGWNFATDTQSGIEPMNWDPSSNQWVGPGTRVSQSKIEASGSNTAKLCVHADVGGDTGGGTEGPYTVSINVVALPGGASLTIWRADSGMGGLPDMSTAENLLGYTIVLSGGQPCRLKSQPITIQECQWVVFEVDDPTPETPINGPSWGMIRAIYR